VSEDFRDLRETKVSPVLQACQDQEESLDRQDLLVSQEEMDSKEIEVYLALQACLAKRETEDCLVKLAHLDRRALQALQEEMDQLDSLESKVTKVFPADQEHRVLRDRLDPKEIAVHRAPSAVQVQEVRTAHQDDRECRGSKETRAMLD